MPGIVLNPKCVFISLGLAAGYWFAPPKNVYVLGSLLVGTYFAIAWYDELYDVPRSRRLKQGFLSTFPIYRALKPKY